MDQRLHGLVKLALSFGATGAEISDYLYERGMLIRESPNTALDDEDQEVQVVPEAIRSRRVASATLREETSAACDGE
jgi:hypothetical protein